MYSLAFLTYYGFYVSREPYSLVKMTLLKTWAPFNGHDGWLLLGILDTASLGEIFREKKLSLTTRIKVKSLVLNFEDVENALNKINLNWLK